MSETNTKTYEFNGTNFVGFMKKLNPKLRQYRPNGAWVETKPELLAAFDIIMNSISCKIAETVPTKNDDPVVLFNYLNATYGEKNLMDAEEKFDTFRMNGIDPDLFISDLEILEGRIELAGGSVTPKQWFTVLTRNIHSEFYQEFYRKTRMEFGTSTRISAENIENVKANMKAWYNNTHADIRANYRKKPETALALKTTKKTFENRFCSYCKGNGHPKIYRTHNEPDCKAKVWDRERAEKSKSEGNKPDQAYYDTGASNHMSPTIPLNLNKNTKGSIETATGGKTPLLGSSTFKLGQIEVENVLCAPGLDFNLVSGSQLAKEGYTAVIDTNNENDLIISKNGAVVATGDFNDQNLLVINEDFYPVKRPAKCDKFLPKEPLITTNMFGLLTQSNKDHVLFGHLGCISDTCDVCIVTKRRKRNTPKSSTPKENLSVLEKVHVDIQGPFPIASIDGTRMNIKAVDSHSGYVKMELIHDKTADTTKDFIKRFHTRSERQTGKMMKSVCTDSGNEFNGAFLAYLEEFGITKRKGHGYDHHFPPDAENANRIILNMARALLLQSKLPENYYGEAMLCASYLLNRWSSRGKPSRYEKFFERKPIVDHLKPFGSICFAFIPAEKRSKLENTRERCRLIGYGDDDDTEEMAGYKLLVESDGLVLYSNDVVFSDENIVELSNNSRNIYDPDVLEVFQPRYEDSQDGDYIPTDISGTTFEEVSQSTAPSGSNAVPSVQVDNIIEINDASSETSEDRRQDEIIQEINERQHEIFSQPPDTSNANLIYRVFLTHKQDKSIPEHLKDALESTESKQWLEAIRVEEESMRKMGVYHKEENKLPGGVRWIGSRWVFAKKFDENGGLIKYKARLVARGFMEKYGIDFEDVFAPVAHYNSIRTVIGIAASRNWKIYQDDMSTAFLNAVLPHTKWIKLPNGKFVEIKKALYGLKEAPKEWFETFKAFMFEEGFSQSPVEPCIFNKDSLIVALYVDDTLSTGEEEAVLEFREKLQGKFKCGSGGLASLYLGLAIKQSKESIALSQSHYIEEKLDLFKEYLGSNEKLKCSMPLVPQFQEILLEADKSDEFEPLFPYRSMVGTLNHLVSGTRFDIAAATSIVSKFLHKPKKIHCDMVRRIYFYLRDTVDLNLTFKLGSNIYHTAYCDSSFANLENYRSLCGHLLLLGDTPVVWQSSRQQTIAKSTQQAEYMALTPALQDVLWMKMLLKDLGIQSSTIPIFEDNEACISLANNPQSSRRTRHIQVIYHWIREHLDNNSAKLFPIGTSYQLADLLTKGIYGPALRTAREKLCLIRTEVLKQGKK